MYLSILLLQFLLAVPLLAGVDTLRHYSPVSRELYFQDNQIEAQYARFEPKAPGYIRGFSIALGGKEAGEALVHLYGYEGGSMVPVLEKDLIAPIKIRKTGKGIEHIEVKLSRPLFMDARQFFVGIDHLSPHIFLVSDSQEKEPGCSSDEGDSYYYQYVRLANGEWRSYKYSYLIDALMDYSTESSPHYLQDVTTAVGLPDSLPVNSLAWADINNDSYPDLLAGGHLYKNNKGVFEDITHRAGLPDGSVLCFFIDINNDHAQDILCIGQGGQKNSIFLNEGSCHFTESSINLPPILHPASFSIADINNDSYPDLFIGQSGQADGHPLPDYLLLNTGTLQFRDISDSLHRSGGPSGKGYGSMWVDFNNDGLLDLFITRSDNLPCELWQNRGNCSFARADTTGHVLGNVLPGYNSIGCDWMDYDNDGNLDALVMHSSPLLLTTQEKNYCASMIFRNSGAPLYNFTKNMDSLHTFLMEFAEERAGGSWGDVNNDGLPDFFVNTMSSCHYGELYIQNTDHSFESGTFDYGLSRIAGGEDAVWIDYNNDGRLDLATAYNGYLRVYQNNSQTGNRYAAFTLESVSSNHTGIGARVTVYAGKTVCTRELVSGRGVRMQGAPVVYVGLGSAENIDSVVVQWPNATTENFGPMSANTSHILTEGASHPLDRLSLELPLEIYPNPLSEESVIHYALSEDGDVRLFIYSLQNKLIRTLAAGYQQSGDHRVKWDGKDSKGVRVASGVYLVRLQTHDKERAVRVVVSE